MCGIVGVINLKETVPVSQELLLQMLETINHRGPEGYGIYRDVWAGLGNARLSIIDLDGGDQPIGNEDGSLWIVFNGEIFNYLELRSFLEKRGHQFSTQCDTEVVLHLYEDIGPKCLSLLNGQFTIAIWNKKQRTLFLARDRIGIRPIFYTNQNGRFVFGSEIKALLAHPSITAEIDRQSLRETFTFWSTLSPRTIFSNIVEIPPAHYLMVQDGQVLPPCCYWELDFTTEKPSRNASAYLEELEALLVDASRIRLRADVPVGAYLSGGLDSSLTTALVRAHQPNQLDTFSISFEDPKYDEQSYQDQVARYLNTNHHELHCHYTDISRAFPEVIWHTEAPILRTAPVPMFLLSQLVNDHGFKVVLTGEGADEFLAGYDIFKEMKIRRFWAAEPESRQRPKLLGEIYPDITSFGGGFKNGGAFLTAFYKQDLALTNSPFYSHLVRWRNSSRSLHFLAKDVRFDGDTIFQPSNGKEGPVLPEGYASWGYLAQAQYLEIVTFLSPYLLSSQGDRMSMAHSVEGRYPFLDVRVIEFTNRLPPEMKMPVLIEKWLLKQLGKKYLPENIWQRKKRPYRAPIHRSFFAPNSPAYVSELLSETAIRDSGYFDPGAVTRLVKKASGSTGLSEVEDMALVGILSTQLVYQMFVHEPRCLAPNAASARVKVIDHLVSNKASSDNYKMSSEKVQQ